MKKQVCPLVGMALLCWFARSAWSQASVAAPAVPTQSSAVKVGIINIQRAIAESNDGKKGLEELTKRFTPKKNELQKLQDEIAGLQKRLEAPVLSDETRASGIKELERKQKQLQRETDDANSAFQDAEGQLINTIGAKAMKVIDEYARKNAYDVILDVSGQQSPVLWAQPRVDITDEIITAYNVANPATPAAAAGSGANPPGAGSATGAQPRTGTGSNTATPRPGTSVAPVTNRPPATKPATPAPPR